MFRKKKKQDQLFDADPAIGKILSPLYMAEARQSSLF